jgi:uncharacterized protein
MPETNPPQPEPEEVKAEPFDAEADRAAGARVRDAGPGPTQADARSSNAWAMACHLSGLADLAIPFLFVGILIPLGIWLARRPHDAFVDDQGKEVLNFQLNLLFWALIFGALTCCCGIGLPALFALSVYEIVITILGAVAAADGRKFRYPYLLRVIA